ncbi:MAG TPA: glycosyltransferase [Candidatus Saccharimonadales bacterium]|nr:glycosyltransferase [Candidatus Saccharimonadales bacterium]
MTVSALGIYFIVYGVLAISHILVQMVIGHKEHRRQKAKHFTEWHQGHYPSVSVIVPSYNEEPDILDACVRSIANQDYESLEILVVDDGSSKRESLKTEVYDHLAKLPGVHIIYTPINVGKRHAQKFGFNRSTGEIIVTVDSDTVLPQGAIKQLMQRFKDPTVGAVTGDVQVENNKVNTLTRLIGYRYWSAFHQERAAQSYFYVLMCCSGPFSAYRKSVIDHVKDSYTSQNFLGRRCTFGDDRHLTNLVLEEGYRVVFDNKAIALTHVPEDIRTYIKQQVRWNKSFYREMLWTLRSYKRHHNYMIYDLVMQLVLPFLLVIALAGMVYQSFVYGPHVVLHYVATIVVIAILRAAYGLYRTKDAGFLLFVLYGFIHLFLLMPTRLYALCTMRETGWGTR